MTFIASVVAKKGVAVIADSLVTSSQPILHHKKFIDYLAAQPPNVAGEIVITPNDIASLFEWEATYTKDFEEKLFEFNDFTAITTTGIASINDKKIVSLVNEFKAIRQADFNDFSISIDVKLDQFSDYLTEQIKEHLTKYTEIGSCTFIFSFYERSTSITHIYKIITIPADSNVLTNQAFVYLSRHKEVDWAKVVCDGQNKISDNILYGFGRPLYLMFPDIVNNILNKLTLPDELVPANFIDTLKADDYFNNIFYGDVEMLNLSELSLQQAVDLASLLMRVEVDFQKYTRNIPTVGGVIKLAVIDDKGFRFILGDAIEPPKHIHL
jgi:hypothetical protein